MLVSVPSYLLIVSHFFVPSPPQIYLQINIARLNKALEMRGMGVDRGSSRRSRWASHICLSFYMYMNVSYMYPDAFAIFPFETIVAISTGESKESCAHS